MATNFLALDVGTKRVGVAVARGGVRIASPLTTLTNDDGFWDSLQAVINTEDIGTVVVGLPRGLEGQDTAQTMYCRQFAENLERRFSLPVILQDEALTSVKAEEELQARGKPFEKGAVDALAATYILEDYLGVTSL